MKQSMKKMTRGQMVYAPITATERTSRSPFGKNAVMSSSAKSLAKHNQQYDTENQQNAQHYYEIQKQQQTLSTPYRQSASTNKQSNIKKQQSSFLIKNNSNPYQNNNNNNNAYQKNNSNELNNSNRSIQQPLMSSPPKVVRISSPPKIGRISSQSNQVYLENQSSPSRNKHTLTNNFNVSNSPATAKLPSSSKNNPYNNQHQLQFQSLFKENELLKSREQIYISKLIKLQQGLQRQHQQFMNLQDLYTELFHVYKLKQQEFAQLQKKYKEMESNDRFQGIELKNQANYTEKYGSFGQGTGEFNDLQNGKQKLMQNFNSSQQNLHNNSAMSSNSINYALYEQAFKQQLSQLIYQNKRLNETNQKLVTELNYLKSKHNLQSSKQFLDTKFITEISETQKQLQSQKEQKLQLQYQNKYLQLRIQDLEKTITELEGIITLKQTEIIKIRQEKIHMRKHSSENTFNKSPPKQDSARSKKLDSARSKSSNTEKKYNKLIDNLQRQNQKLRDQNLQLKQKLKSSLTTNLANSRLFNDPSTNLPQSINRKLNFNQSQQMKYSLSNQNLMSLRSYQNENFNSQNINEQYFSFSRQREDKFSQQDLPSFPMDLEIEKIIKKHQQKCSIITGDHDENFGLNQHQCKQTDFKLKQQTLQEQCSI